MSQLSTALQVLPLSLKEFEIQYGASKQEYFKYLKKNANKHHYGRFKTLEDWYEFECKTR